MVEWVSGGTDLDLDPVPWKILWIRIRQNDADPMDPDPQHWCICSVYWVHYCRVGGI